jgi:hypothetical protein
VSGTPPLTRDQFKPLLLERNTPRFQVIARRLTPADAPGVGKMTRSEIEVAGIPLLTGIQFEPLVVVRNTPLLVAA